MIGEKIKRYRVEKGLTQSDLAKLCDISRVAIGNYERNDRIPSIESTKKIADALNVSLNDLVSKTDDKYPSIDIEILKLELNEIEILENALNLYGYELSKSYEEEFEKEIEEFKNHIKLFVDAKKI